MLNLTLRSSILIFFILCFSNIGYNQELNYKIIQSFPSPGYSPQGLTHDGKYLWVVDDSTNFIYKIDPISGEKVGKFLSQIDKPRGIASYGKFLFFSGNLNPIIYKIRASGEDTGKIESSIDLTHQLKMDLISGIIWDGNYLYFSYFAGWSSSIVCYNINKNKKVFSFFADAEDLAFDGRYLWYTDSQNGNSRGFIKKCDFHSGKEIAYFRTPGYYPTGLAVDGDYLWHSDEKQNYIYKIEIVK